MRFRSDFSIGVMQIVKNIEEMLAMGKCLSKISEVKRTETVITTCTDKWPLPRTYTSTMGKTKVIA